MNQIPQIIFYLFISFNAIIRRLVFKTFFLAEQKKQKQLEYSSLGLHFAVILNVFGRLCISLPGVSYLTSDRGNVEVK